jgi:TatD DNase family protein
MDDVIKRTLKKGVFMITVGTQKDTSKNGLLVSEKYDGLWASVGLHPNHLVAQSFFDDDELPPEKQTTNKIKTRTEDFDYEYFRKLAQHPKCVAIGECGLDFHRIPEEANKDEVIEKQYEVVRQHFDLATEMNLPIIIHCRDGYDEQADLVFEYTKEGKLQAGGVVHCFSGNLEQANKFIDLGLYVSFTGTITFPARKKDVLIDGLTEIQNVVKNIPLEKILIETDSPYLTPLPYRGKRNEPSYVEFVAQKVAYLKNVSVDHVAKQTTLNAKKLFKL